MEQMNNKKLMKEAPLGGHHFELRINTTHNDASVRR